MNSDKNRLNLSDNLCLYRDDNKFLGADRIRLLEKIDELGSITKAAKAVGICYKTAWDTVSTINNLAEEPLVDSLTGGKGGGGTRLTTTGKEIVTQFNLIQQELRRHLDTMEEKLGNSESLHTFLRRHSMRVSARNIFYGVISSITKSSVTAEITLTLKGDMTLTSVITNGAVENLGLKSGMNAYAIVKASSVMIGAGLDEVSYSARNVFSGTVVRIINGTVSCEVDLEVNKGAIISATITHESVSKLGLKKGSRACALFKASDVMLGIT